jgi:hypothetical protein
MSMPRLILLLPMLLLAGLSSARGADSHGRLTVEGSALVLDTGDGSLLRGAELAGATLLLPVEGRPPAEVLILSVTPDPKQPDLLRHEFRIADDAGGSKPACTPNIDGETWGFPVALPAGHPGREGAITITCVSGAVGKCARFGYRPWATGPRGEALVPLHAACVRMVRGDYCGDSQPHTKDGTGIDLYDDLGIQTPSTRDDAAFTFEAGWSPQGAVCVARTRWPDLIGRDALFAQCPRLATTPSCDEATARRSGARLFNRTRIKPFTVSGRDRTQ